MALIRQLPRRIPSFLLHLQRRAIMTESFKPTWPAQLYASARPDYPREVIDPILEAVGEANQADSAARNYVDLAAGTGIFTRLLVEAAKDTPAFKLASVVAVEPSQGMRQQLASTLFADEQGVIAKWKAEGQLDASIQTLAIEGRFDSIDLSQHHLQGKVDLLTIAQAWHWCEDYNAALNAIAKVLKPGGVLALVWNLEDREKARWVALVRDEYEQYEGNSRQYRHEVWREMYKTEAIKQFDILPEQHIQRNLPTTVEGVVDRVLSKSYISMEPQEKQDEIAKDVRAVFDRHSDQDLERVWIDQAAGTFEYPYRSDVFLFRKK